MKLKINNRILITILFLLIGTDAYTQSWIWAKSAGGTGSDGPDFQLLCIDNSGNTYQAGSFYSSQCYFPNDTLQLDGLYNLYVAKYDANGNEIWAKRLGGHNNTSMQQQGINSINYNSNRNSIIVCGSYYGTAIFGNDTLVGSPDGGFLAEMDTNGNFNWVKNNSILLSNVDNDGNIYAEYYIKNPAGNIDTLVVAGGIWIAKYSPTGKLLHANKIFNLNGNVFGYDAYLQKINVQNGKLFGIGFCTVNTFNVEALTVHADYNSDQYILACFDTSGSAIWVKPCAGTSSHYICDVTTDEHNNSYITGPFYNSAIFGQDTIYVNLGKNQDFFIAKYDSNGNNSWVRQTHIGDGLAFSIALDNSNGLYVTGSLSDSIVLGADTIIASSVNGDMFIARFDSAGHFIGAKQVGDATGNAIVCDESGDIYITGAFGGTINVGSTQLVSKGASDIFIVKSDVITGIALPLSRKSNQLLIYANPNAGICDITVPVEFQNAQNLMLSIFDNSGKIVQQIPVEMNGDKIKINLQEQAKGIYNVTLCNSSNTCYTGKIVFE